MPHTIADLISIKNLSEADVKNTLLAAGLPLEQNEYTDEDIGKFDAVREFFDSKQVRTGDYDTAKELFATLTVVKSKPRSPSTGAQSVKTKKGQKNTPNSTPSPSPVDSKEASQTDSEAKLSVIDLINLVKGRLDLTLTLKQVVAILEAASLPDKESYTQAEANRFLIACRIVAQEGEGDIGSRIEDAVAAMETGLIGLVSEVTSERAKQVPDLVKQLYLQNVARSLVENQEDIESFFMQLKGSIIKGIEGKSRVRSILEQQWIAPLPQSPPSPNQSLPTSEDGTIIDLRSESD